MTCVIGYVSDNGDIFMGSDSMAVSLTDWMILREPKIFIKNDMIFGTASSLRFGQILKYSFNAPLHLENISTNEYICHDVMIELNKTFEKVSYKKDDKGDDEDWTFLLGYQGRLYTVQSNLQIVEDVNRYATIGCGGDFAKGALYVMDQLNKTPENKITKALEAASQFSMVKEPFHILKLDFKQNSETNN